MPEIATAPASEEPFGRADIRTALFLFCAAFAFYFLSSNGQQPYGDEKSYVHVARSLLLYGEPAKERVVLGDRGTIVLHSHRPIGQSLFLIPFVALSGMLELEGQLAGRLLLNMLPLVLASATVGALYLLLRLVGSTGRTTSAALAAATATGTQLWVYASTLYAEVTITFFTTAAVLLSILMARTSKRFFAALCACIAATVLCKPVFVLLVPPIGWYLWVNRARVRIGLFQAVGGLLLLVTAGSVLLWHNLVRYGKLFNSGYGEAGRDAIYAFSTPWYEGLFGLLLSPGSSFFLYSPVCLLGLLALPRFYKYARSEAILLSMISLLLVLVYAKWWSWHGGWSWGCRFLLPLVPLLILPLSSAPLQRRVWKWSLAVAVILGALVQIPGLLISPLNSYRLVGAQVPMLDRTNWRLADINIRNDMPHVQFIPHFSPIAVHSWMAWAKWNPELSESDIAAAAPWVSLNRHWAPREVRRYLRWEPWLLNTRERTVKQP